MVDVEVSDSHGNTWIMQVDPGDASVEVLTDLFTAMSDLSRTFGGDGLQFKVVERDSIYRRLYKSCRQLLDIKYMGCPFPEPGGMPCGNCTACHYTRETSAKAWQSIADADKMFGWDNLDQPATGKGAPKG